ncbi:MAG: HAD family hydrolase [Candidatus Thorarchaeota archaeon]
MNASTLIAAVMFDVDGVVVESELLHLKTFNEILAPFEIQITENEWKTKFLGAGSAVIMSTIFDENGIAEDPEPLIMQRRIRYRERVENGELQSVSGFSSFYDTVREANIPIAFVSTGHPISLNAALKSLGLLDKHLVIDATQVIHVKPNPEPYLLGAKSLLVPPEQCLVFEDSPRGVSAAKSAQMTCVALTTTNPAKDLTHADLIIPNFDGLTIQTLCEKLGKRLKG